MTGLPLEPRFQTLRDALGVPEAQVVMNLLFEFQDSFAEAHVLNYDKLVITFEDAGYLGSRPNGFRPGWGVAPLLKRGVSVMAIKPKWRSWYGNPALPDGLKRLAPFLSRFSEILHYGNSMGGYGALTYADLTGARRVVALAPQTAYREVEGKQETRFPSALSKSEDDRFWDAVQGCRRSEVWVFYDKLVPEDRWHASRLQGADKHHVAVPCSHHFVPPLLAQVGALPLILDLLLTGRLDRDTFYRRLRRRREFKIYHDALRAHAGAHPSVKARLERLLLTEPPHDPDKNDAFASRTE